MLRAEYTQPKEMTIELGGPNMVNWDLLAKLNNIQNGEQRENQLARLNLIWKHKVGRISQDIGAGNYLRGQSFYPSTYKCPKCGQFLDKARASISVKANNGHYASTNSIFACFNCQNLFISDAESGLRLGDGEYYTMDDTRKFLPAAKIIDDTAQGTSPNSILSLFK